ncbi:MAG: hypothetical protein ABIQ06_09455, partial [Caldimonas sp.]
SRLAWTVRSLQESAAPSLATTLLSSVTEPADESGHRRRNHFLPRSRLRPIYEKTAAYGHFGRDEPEFTWERTDRAAALKAAAEPSEVLAGEAFALGERKVRKAQLEVAQRHPAPPRGHGPGETA